MLSCNEKDTGLNVTWLEREPTSTWSTWMRALEKPLKEEKQMIAKRDFVSASSDTKWNAINWSKCQKSIQGLQARIVQATKIGRWNKVKSLQRILTRSFSAKALAIKRVTTNKGKWTPGVDGQVWQTTTEKLQGISKLKHRRYKPLPLRRVYIPKANGQKRPLGIPTIKDRAMQALHLMGLEPVAETIGDHHSYGFRRHRSAADAMSQIYKTLAGRNRAQWILEGDIKRCFDEINHPWLMKAIPIEKSILHKWLKAGYIEGKTLFPTTTGTPQGGIISPVLANMALDGLDAILERHFGKKGSKKRQGSGVYLIRYADDFIVTGKSREILETRVKPAIEQFLVERGLAISADKTTIVHVEQGFDFLGQNTRRYKSKLIIKPSLKSTVRLLNRIRNLVRKNRATSQADLITMLNPQIRGWTYYHRHVCSRKTFEKIDHEIFTVLWRWATRRHPNKSRKWVKAKYFIPKRGQQWCFSTVTKNKEESKKLELFKATDVPIRRQVKIRAEANPFNKTWYPYFEERSQKGTTIGVSSNYVDRMEINP